MPAEEMLHYRWLLQNGGAFGWLSNIYQQLSSKDSCFNNYTIPL